MNVFLPRAVILTVASVVISGAASAGDCNKNRGRVLQSRRVHVTSPRQVTTSRSTPVHASPTVVVHESSATVVPYSTSVVTSNPVTTQPKAVALPDIVDTAVAAGSFKTLAAALGAADLVGALKDDGPFTVFAPTDDAFAKLPAGTVEELLKPENKDKLRDILLLHVVAGKVAAADVVKVTEAKSLGGGKLLVSATDGVKVGTASGMANVVKTDIPAKNGLIHVIDSVILP